MTDTFNVYCDESCHFRERPQEHAHLSSIRQNKSVIQSTMAMTALLSLSTLQASTG